MPEVDFTPCEQRDSCPRVDASDATNDLAPARDVADASKPGDAPDARDVVDASDAPDVVDVSDAPDVPDAPDAPADVACGAGERNCGGVCRVVQDDPLNCGACGRACRPDQVCASGACECATARNECGGVCRNLATDPSNCGLCGRACASGMCVSGTCACSAGQTDCGGACRNLMTDAANCGRCGVVCRSGACTGGACVPEQRSCAVAGTVGCGLVEVAGGTFSMGSNTACTGSSSDPVDCAAQGSPVQPMITVSAFAIDAFEVTVTRFRAFWNARMADGGASIRARPVAYPGGRFIEWATPGNEPQQMGSGPSCNWNRTTGTRDAHPINCVEWRTALEFCVWDGGRLPTEAEWEFVARGRAVPDEGLVPGRIFPWGDDASSLCGRAQVQGCPGVDLGLTRRVGSFSASGALFDLAGNVDEWTADTYALYSDAMCWAMPRQTNPLCSSGSPSNRTARGGSITVGLPRSASRYGYFALSPMAFTGFRCARSR